MGFAHKFVWLSDLHITASGQIEGVACADRLRAAVAQINQWHSDADACIITGDLVHNGLGEEYAVLVPLLDELAVPVVPLIGNHDNRAALRSALPPPGTAMAAFHQMRWDCGNVTLLCLDTHLQGDDAGAMDAARLDWLSDQLAQTADRQVLVFMHHPPGPLGLGPLDDMPLRDDVPLIAMLAGAPQVVHLFCGHVHRPVSGTIGGVPFTCLRALAHQVRPGHEGWDWTNYLAPDERPQYGVILTAPDRVVVQAVDLVGAA